jgi:hypothetical protein
MATAACVWLSERLKLKQLTAIHNESRQKTRIARAVVCGASNFGVFRYLFSRPLANCLILDGGI